jgi:hypothetical protein
MSAEFRDLADLVTNTPSALLGIKTVRPLFHHQSATSEIQKHKCENTLLVLLEPLETEKNSGIKRSLAVMPAKPKGYVDIEKQSCLVLVEDYPEFSMIRQLRLMFKR